MPGSPFVAGEYEIDEVKSIDLTSKTVFFARAVVDGIETRFFRPGLVVTVEESGGVWRLNSFNFFVSVAYATPAEVAQLAACTPDAPPDLAKILASMFDGVYIDNCRSSTVSGEYTYVANSSDAVEWTDPPWNDPPTWLGSLGAPGDGDDAIRWGITRPARFVIDPANFWPEIESADCYCDGTAGYTLVVDAVDGTTLQYTPGLDCPAC